MNMNSFLELYKDKQKLMTSMSNDFNWEGVEEYCLWLKQTYEYALSSTRILALTAGSFSVHHTALSNRFIKHASEEKGHDKLLMNDAKNLKIDLNLIETLAEAEAFHKSLYYWIYQGKPLVILGWILCLEGFAVNSAKNIYERVEKAHGKKATSFIYVHSKEDEDHIQKAFESLNDLSHDDLMQVAHGFSLYTELYINIYRSIRRKVSASDYLQEKSA